MKRLWILNPAQSTVVMVAASIYERAFSEASISVKGRARRSTASQCAPGVNGRSFGLHAVNPVSDAEQVRLCRFLPAFPFLFRFFQDSLGPSNQMKIRCSKKEKGTRAALPPRVYALLLGPCTSFTSTHFESFSTPPR